MTATPITHPAKTLSPLPWWPAWMTAIYGLIVLLVGLIPALDAQLRLQLTFHSTVLPLAALNLCALFVVARTPMLPLRRRAWIVYAVWIALKLAVLLLVVSTAPPGVRPPPVVNLATFIAFTPIGILSLYYFYRDVGGSLARPGVLLDAAALMLGGGAMIYVLVIGPAHVPHAGLGRADEMALTLSLMFPVVLAGLLYTHLPDMNADRTLMLLLVAAMVALGGDLTMILADASDPLLFTRIFSLFFIFASATGMAALACESRRLPPAPAPSSEPRYSLLPAVVILGGALAAFTVAYGRHLLQHPVAPLLLVLAGSILVAREVLSRSEQRRRLQQEQELLESFETARRERAALSGEIHEELAQNIAAVQYVLSASRKNPDAGGPAVELAVQQLGRSVAHAQDIASQLAPARSKEQD